MTSGYVDVSSKLFSEVGHDEYIILCNFVGRSINDFKVIEEDPLGRRKHTKQSRCQEFAGRNLPLKYLEM